MLGARADLDAEVAARHAVGGGRHLLEVGDHLGERLAGLAELVLGADVDVLVDVALGDPTRGGADLPDATGERTREQPREAEADDRGERAHRARERLGRRVGARGLLGVVLGVVGVELGPGSGLLLEAVERALLVGHERERLLIGVLGRKHGDLRRALVVALPELGHLGPVRAVVGVGDRALVRGERAVDVGRELVDRLPGGGDLRPSSDVMCL
nr:hypothetical protein [Solirubrobacter soli]